jgi:ABC-2 type transport system ATP-binding protein
MKKRLYFALAILSDPKILILDEPFNGIDPVSVAFFEKILKGYKEAGKMILISSHEIRELQSFIDEAVILDKGKIVYDETVKAGDDLFSIFLSHVSQGGEAQ